MSKRPAGSAILVENCSTALACLPALPPAPQRASGMPLHYAHLGFGQMPHPSHGPILRAGGHLRSYRASPQGVLLSPPAPCLPPALID